MVAIHPSDEMYGADRILLEVLRSAPSTAEVWLPSDVEYGGQELSTHLRRAGIRVVRRGMPILRRDFMRPRHAGRLALDMLRGLMGLARTRPRVVYLNTSATLTMAWAAKLVGARVILHVHEVWRAKEARALGLLARFADHIVCVSEASHSALPPALQQRAVVIHNGVPEPAGLTPVTHEGSLVFLMASRWNAWKGHEVVMRAWEEATKDPDFDGLLVMLGGPPKSGAAVDVAGLRSRLGRPDTVVIVGETPDVGPHLMRADYVLVPSILPDPLPTIAIEAAAAGLPVVASRIGGLPEIIVDGETGVLFEAGDAAALAKLLRSLDRAHGEILGLAARHHYERKFSPERFRSEIRSVLASDA